MCCYIQTVVARVRYPVVSRQSWRWDRSDNALQAYTVFFGLLALGQLPVLKTVHFAELPYFIGLASLTIYIGAHRGLTNKVRPYLAAKRFHQCVCPVGPGVLDMQMRERHNYGDKYIVADMSA